MGAEEMVKLADWMNAVVRAPDDAALLDRTANEIRALCAGFPAPGL
jgi:glycine hydroxymethyltransferase